MRTNSDDCWLVEDILSPSKPNSRRAFNPFNARLHWLLPDWPWELSQAGNHVELRLSSPQGTVVLALDCIATKDPEKASFVQLVRSGKLLAGSGEAPVVGGWYSPTYNVRLPALSLSLTVEAALPVTFQSEWEFQG